MEGVWGGGGQGAACVPELEASGLALGVLIAEQTWLNTSGEGAGPGWGLLHGLEVLGHDWAPGQVSCLVSGVFNTQWVSKASFSEHHLAAIAHLLGSRPTFCHSTRSCWPRAWPTAFGVSHGCIHVKVLPVIEGKGLGLRFRIRGGGRDGNSASSHQPAPTPATRGFKGGWC
jgi:hypothetical protein